LNTDLIRGRGEGTKGSLYWDGGKRQKRTDRFKLAAGSKDNRSGRKERTETAYLWEKREGEKNEEHEEQRRDSREQALQENLIAPRGKRKKEKSPS